MLDVELASLVNVAHNQLIAGQAPQRLGNAHPSIVPYETFATADGDLALAVATEDQWTRFCAAIGQSDLADDPRFRRNRERVANRADLMAVLEPVLGVGRWTTGSDSPRRRRPCGPVNTVDRILEDPGVRDSGLLRTIERDAGPIRVVGSPLRFGTGDFPATEPPALGQHTRAVLGEAGFDPAAIDALGEAGVIRAADSTDEPAA